MRTYEINREEIIDTNKEIVLIEEIGRHIERREAGKNIFSDLQQWNVLAESNTFL